MSTDSQQNAQTGHGRICSRSHCRQPFAHGGECDPVDPPAAQQPIPPEAYLTEEQLFKAYNNAPYPGWDRVIANTATEHAVAVMQDKVNRADAYYSDTAHELVEAIGDLKTLTKPWEATQIELAESQAEVARLKGKVDVLSNALLDTGEDGTRVDIPALLAERDAAQATSKQLADACGKVLELWAVSGIEGPITAAIRDALAAWKAQNA